MVDRDIQGHAPSLASQAPQGSVLHAAVAAGSSEAVGLRGAVRTQPVVAAAPARSSEIDPKRRPVANGELVSPQYLWRWYDLRAKLPDVATAGAMNELSEVPAGPAIATAITPTVVLRLRLIGPMDAWSVTGERVLPRARKTRAVLAVLAMAAPNPVPRARLVRLLWSRRGEEQARASLRQAVHELQGVLAPLGSPVIEASRDQIAVRAGSTWTDAVELTLATLEHPAALSLLNGQLLEDLDGLDPGFDAWLQARRRELRDGAAALAEALLGRETEPRAQTMAAQRLLAVDRTHEGGWRALMKAHAAVGERGLALDALEQCRAELRERLGAQPSPETLSLGEQIRQARGTVSSAPPPPPPGPATLLRPLSRGARLGVLPLRGIELGTHGHLSFGLAEEITNALSRFRWIGLVAPSSLTRFTSDEQGAAAAARGEADLDFLLDGTVQRAGERVRVMLRLLDLRASGEVVWAGRFDRADTDVLSLQDEIAAEVVAQIDPQLLLMEAKRAMARPLTDPSAYDLMLRAIPAIHRLEHRSYLEAGDLLSRAIEIDPDYAAAHAWYAYWHVFYLGQGWAEDPPAAMERARELAERAIMLDPNDARGLTIAGHIRVFMGRRHEEALALHDRAILLNPNLPLAWALSGMSHAYAGTHVEAVQRVLHTRRLAPFDPLGFFFDHALMIPKLLLKQHEEVVALGQQVLDISPGFTSAMKVMLAALGHLRRAREAEPMLARLLQIEPQFCVSEALARVPFRVEADRTHYAEGLRLVGLLEG